MDFLIGYLGAIMMGNAVAFALVVNHHTARWALTQARPDITKLFLDYITLSSLVTLTTVEAMKIVLART